MSDAADAAPETLFLILAQAAAGPTTTYLPGSRHTLLAFARAGDHQEAIDVATRGLEARDWVSPAFQKAGIIELGPHLSPEDRAPAEHALQHGFALRVYGA